MAVVADAQESLLKPVATEQPDAEIFPPRGDGREYPPSYNALSGPKQTNKFWANWGVENPTEKAEETMAIFVMPYALMWRAGDGSKVAELSVSHNKAEEVLEYDNGLGADRVQKYFTPFAHEFSLGCEEPLGEHHSIVKETLFGVHIEVAGPEGNETQRKITYPIFQGMAYVSGRYEGDITPKVGADGPLKEVEKVGDGIWKFVNDRSTEFRVYALDPQGALVDGSYTFDIAGVMNKNLDGWLRLAKVTSDGDAAALDAHASAVLIDWAMDVKADGASGKLEYTFTMQVGASDPSKFIHFAFPHHVALLANEPARMALVDAPTKGQMTALVGNAWSMEVDIAAAEALSWLPSGEALPASRASEILTQAREDLANWEQDGNWQKELLQNTYYFSGKGFQKLGSVCLMLEELAGAEDEATKRCADILAEAFTCMYDVNQVNANCASRPSGSYYDELWGGIPSKDGFFPSATPCYDFDFGNACYNDHHYHFGYFVVSAAMLVKFKPEMKDDVKFVGWVNTLIRDTANPSAQDTYFPHFRCFDWFDFHSWSRGVMPSPEGKDQESTSEEVNLLYGLVLWGGVMGDTSLKALGATMMTLETMAIKAYFLMKTGNTNHHPDFVKNHVTGIFFQNLVRYDTWFGNNPEFIHGIQMLPLSPALQMTRDSEFCQQEWEDVLVDLDHDASNPWTSIINTGNLAMWRRDDAWDKILPGARESFDDGLTKSFSLYWTAKQPPQRASTNWTTIAISAVVVALLGLGAGVFFCQPTKAEDSEVQLGQELAEES